MRYSTHVNLDKESQAIIAQIPAGFKSQVLRGLVKAYGEYAKDKTQIAPYVVAGGSIKIIEDILEETNVDR